MFLKKNHSQLLVRKITAPFFKKRTEYVMHFSLKYDVKDVYNKTNHILEQVYPIIIKCNFYKTLTYDHC